MSQIVNELLFYVAEQYDKTTRQALEVFLSDNFTIEDVLAAKSILIAECDKVGISDDISDSRRGRQKKNILLKVIKDILDIWDVVDRLKGGQLLCHFIRPVDNGVDRINPISKPSHQPFDSQLLVAALFTIILFLDSCPLWKSRSVV